MDKQKHRYYWEGTNHLGEKMRGIIDTTSIAIVKTELHKQGISSKRITRRNFALFTQKITVANIALFCRQTATLLNAGIPLMQSFVIVAQSQSNLSMTHLITSIKKDIESGLPLSLAFAKHPSFFNELTCNLVAIGEKSGKLEVMLNTIANYKEKIAAIKKKLTKALIYPLIVLFIACGVTFVLLTLVVPQFATLFKSFGAELPLLTRLIIQLSDFVKTNWLILLFLTGSLSYAFDRLRKRWFRLNQGIDRLLLKCPLIGSIFSKAIIARFARTLATTCAAGLPLVEGLAAAEGITASRSYAKAIASISENVCAGQQLYVAMKKTHLFPNMVEQMVTVGEESGTLEMMLVKIADFYEDDVNNAIDILSHLLEPIILAILGLIVGGLVIAMYLPIFNLGSVV